MKTRTLSLNRASVVIGALLIAMYPIAAKEHKQPPVASEENAGPLLSTAMKNMSTGVWSVNGTVRWKKTIKLHGLLSGENFDLSMEPGVNPNAPMRGIVIKDKAWVCADGETWHPGTPDDRLVYNWTHTPIMEGRNLPPFEKLGIEDRNGAKCAHVRMKAQEKNVDPKELPQYWIVLDSAGQPQYVGHVELPLMSQAANAVLYASFDYAPAKEKIAQPIVGEPVDEKAHDFNDIDQHKMAWAKKIVRVELDPKLLQSEQIGESTYRGFVKDTAGHYGQIEFPHDSLVRLGFLKKTVSGTHAWEELQKMDAAGRTQGAPVVLYVEIIPIGEKPAARAVAVGAKISREADGGITYSW